VDELNLAVPAQKLKTVYYRESLKIFRPIAIASVGLISRSPRRIAIQGAALMIHELARSPHGLWDMEPAGAVRRSYAVDFARSGFSQRQNSD
jgi:hypothetical protein